MENKTIPGILKNNLLRLIYFERIGIILAACYFTIMLTCSILFHKIGDYGVETDFFWQYIPEAKSFFEGHLLIDAFRGPVYPILLSLFQKVFIDYFIAGLVINTISASISLWIIFELLQTIFNKVIAFISTIFVILNPIFVQYTYNNGTDMLFLFLSYTALYLFFRNKIQISTIIVTALFASLAYLTRYNGIFLLFLVPITFILNTSDFSYKKKLFHSALFLLLFLLFIVPWSIYTYISVGDFFFNHNYKNIAYEYFAKGKISWDNFWFSNSVQYHSFYDIIFHNPIQFINHFFSNLISHFLKDLKELVGLHVGIFFVLGLISFPLAPFKNTKQKAYLLISFIFFIILCLTFYSERFSLFLIPVYTAFSIKFLLDINSIKIFHFPSKYIYSVITIMLYISLCWSLSYNIRKISSGPIEILTLKDYFKNNSAMAETNPIIAARKPHVAYYLNMDFRLIPFSNSYDELYRKLKKQKIDYLYLSTTEMGSRNDLNYLMDTSKTFSGLSVLFCNARSSIILYKIY